jgi:hypothetical protein
MATDVDVRRRGDGGPDTFLEVSLSHDSDFYVRIRGRDHRGNIVEGVVEFCAPNGGGYHPKTRRALQQLMRAMHKDNSDPKSPDRYK